MIKIEKIKITHTAGGLSLDRDFENIEIENQPREFCLSIFNTDDGIAFRLTEELIKIPGLRKALAGAKTEEQKYEELRDFSSEIVMDLYRKILKEVLVEDYSERRRSAIGEKITNAIFNFLKDKKIEIP